MVYSFASSENDTVLVLYTFIYLFFAGCFVAPPTEFVSAGVTIQNLLSHWLGSEDFHFIYYHIKRITATVIIHSILPLGYYLGLGLFAPELSLYNLDQLSILWSVYLIFSLVLLGFSLLLAIYWHGGNWDNHPLAKELKLLGGEGNSWRSVASSINVEFRRVDKFTSGIPSRLVAVTDSWIIKTSTYYVYIAHQNDIHLTLSDAEEHSLSYQNQMAVQYLNITVASIQPGLKPFTIRLNSLELGDLKEKLQAPIRNARNIVIQQSLSDRFLKSFKEFVDSNPIYVLPPTMEVEQCIGCMQKMSDVKLQKNCDNPEGGVPDNNCVQCFCRPMWCMECMGKWFASRQDHQRPETWLSSKSPCPTCRARFCVLDVCKIQTAQ
ncbi:E3 ubiquitin-protein ligase TM129-like [Biomphalaria glabrata]|uniref:E3 ubiquitin-protein ligase TM129-like n=1 Tax=Biomphalaria glabrata TaxID=6526 RepID=A0A9U8ENB0_BIOGL|nr:E3 ubiquitin-protein ligase TM129-like [Biomphalaria glabrata]KAI8777681.1 E3 ubiquitin-protein ligase TM129 [Biomphalaria glabrata]